MKSLFFKTRLFFAAMAVIASGYVLTGCEDDDDDDKNANEVKYENIVINAAQEVPPSASTATGTFNGTYNKTTKILTYTITHNVTAATAAHFHKGAAGASGGVEVPITPITSPISSSTPALTAAQEADLMAGLWYVNIHTPTYPAGEIRGQLPAK